MAKAKQPDVRCPSCRTPLPASACNTERLVACPVCRRAVQVFVFPRFFRGAETGGAGEALGAAGEAACFHHPERRAIVACEECGRFLCSLCHVHLGDRDLCPACIEAGRKAGRLTAVETQRVLYDRVALALALYPLVIPWLGWMATLVTAPMALYIGLRHWKTPLSILPRRRWRFVVARILALLQLVGWVTLVAFVIYWVTR
jgi:hypothetical protein